MTNIEYYSSKNLVDRIEFKDEYRPILKLYLFTVYYRPKHNQEKIELFKQYYSSVDSKKFEYSVAWFLKDKLDNSFISLASYEDEEWY